MSRLVSRHHCGYPAPRESLARAVKRAPRRSIVTELPHIQVDLECGQLPTQEVQPNGHVHVMHPEIAHVWVEDFVISAADHRVAASDRSGGQVPRRHAATRPDSVSNVSRTALVSLRIWKA